MQLQAQAAYLQHSACTQWASYGDPSARAGGSIDLPASHWITDASIQSLVQHCGQIQSIDLSYCRELTNTAIQSLAEHCGQIQTTRAESKFSQ